MTKRIEYIDALRGFAIFLVVFAHVETFGFFHFSYASALGQVIQSFYMPLFFFISGYVAFKSGKILDGKAFGKGLLKKLKVLLVPTLFFGLIYTWLMAGADFKSFFCQPEKFGYWFTVALMEMYILYYLVSYLCHWSKHREALVSIILAAIAIVAFIAKVPFRTIPALDNVGNITSLHYTFSFFQFFVLGNIIARYREKAERILDNKYLSAAAILMFIAVFAYKFKFYNANDAMEIGHGKIISMLLTTILGYLGTIIAFSCFRKKESKFSSEKPFGRNLQFVGRRTLDIYMIHYFFLPDIQVIGDFLKSSGNIAVEVLVGVCLALVIIFISLVVSNILRGSKFLSYWLFGSKEQ